MTRRIVLVTGASSGIGAATAERFSRRGARVVLVARNASRLADVARKISKRDGDSHPYAADLSSADEVADVAERITAEVGVPDVIVNNAGAGRWAPLAETSADELRQMIDVPLMAALYVTRSFLPGMIERRSGSIVCVTSPASFLAWSDACGYIVARRGLKGFCDALRLEVKPAHLHVALVVLGAVDTPYWSNNPGSRVAIPTTHPVLMPKLTAEDAATAIERAVDRRRRMVVEPPIFRLLFALNAIAPRLVERGMRVAAKLAKRVR